MTGQQVLIIGIAIVALVFLVVCIYGITAIISGKKLRKKLDEEYGRKKI